MKNSKLTLSTLFAASLLIGVPGLRAEQGHDHAGHDDAGHDHGHDHASHEHAAEPAKGGAGMGSHAGMSALYKHVGEMEAALAAGKIEDVHGHAEALGGAVRDLDKDTTLTAAKQKRVQGYAKNVVKLANKIHHSADDKNLDQAKRDFPKLKAQVDLLDKQFAHSHKPAAAATPKTGEGHHHHEDK